MIADLLAKAVAQSSFPPGVGSLRWQLARQLMRHLALEDRILYPALQRSGDAQVRNVAAALQSETGSLAEVFARYMAAWSDDRVARQWSGFCVETQQILKVLSERIAREDRTLYPLAEAVDRTSPPATPAARAG